MTAGRRILHVSADYPDAVQPDKTRAISNLVGLTSNAFSNEVLSLNRKQVAGMRDWSGVLSHGRPHLQVESVQIEDGESWIYRAPSRGLFHRAMLEQLGDEIARRYSGDRRPDLIVGHKTTIEGIAVARAAMKLGCPYMLTIQGDTDTKILAARPDLRATLRRVFHGAGNVVSFAPWSLERFEQSLGKRSGPTAIIPCPTELDEPIAPTPDAAGLVTVFHLQSYRRKNLEAMVRAVHELSVRGEAVALGVVGGGSAADIAAAKNVAGETTGVVFEGPLDRQAVRSRINRAAAFVLPSRRESFGMVFVEALFAGCPIIYPAGCSVDGYFDGLPFAIRVPANDNHALAEAMAQALRNQNGLKQALAGWQAEGGLSAFTREAIASSYSHALRQGLSQGLGHAD